ncbi:MAG: hypothetical protein EOP00_27630, partial [Pedobacter sp.]
MANAHVISQTGTGTNLFKDSEISAITSVGGITQSSGSSSLRDVTCDNITMRSGKSITQNGTTNNSLGTTTVTNLVVLTSMEFPAEVTVPEATQTGDLTFTGDAKIVQDITSSTTNVFKDSSFKSMTVNGDITQTSGTATFKTLTCENPSYSGDLVALTNDSSATFENVTINKALSVIGNTTLTNLSLLDSSGNVVISDTELRYLNNLTENVQTQLDDLAANAQTQLDDLEVNLQIQIDDIVAVNDQQTTDIDDLRNDHDTHVSNAVLLSGDQTVGGVKTFTSNVLTNGITNTGSISSSTITSSTITVNDKFSVGNAIKAYENAIESFSSPISVGLSDVLICSFTARNFRRRFNLSTPISLYIEVTNATRPTDYTYYSLQDSFTFTLKLYRDDVFVSTLEHTSSWDESGWVAGSYGIVSNVILQYFYAQLTT